MARRERTTGLPRPAPRKSRATQHRTFAGIPLTERSAGFAIVGAAVLALLTVIGIFAYQKYDELIGKPNSVILSVDGEDFTLRYYADRLGPFAQSNQSTTSSISVLEDQLLSKLETEAVTIKLAEQKGIALDDNSVLDFIAGQLGVPRGGSGSAFDSLYRNQLRQQGISDGNYRRLKKAELANSKLLEQETAAVGTTGDQYTLRTILTDSKDKADAIVKRIQAGEKIGDIAQTDSLDLTSRQQDGLMDPEPLELMPQAIQDALKDKQPGDLLGPVQVQANWWVFTIDRKEPVDYTDQQKSQLAQTHLDALVNSTRDSLRTAGKITTDLTGSDITWAEQHVTKPATTQ